MKIFVIPSWYKTEEYPGNCIFIYEQVEALANLGHKIVVISPQLNLSPTAKHPVEHHNDECSDIYYKRYWAAWPSKLPLQNIWGFRKCARTLFKKAIQEQGIPDVIYAHFSTPAGLIATELGKIYNIPVVVEEHLSDLMENKWPQFRYKVIRETIQNSSFFVCVSDGLKKSIERKLGHFDNMGVVSNMINPCFQFHPIDNNHFVFLSIGGLIPRKGFEFLIRCFAKEFAGSDVELRIAGKGKLRDDLERLIEELDVKKQVRLLGQLTREETLEQYKVSNCFVLASQTETFGLVYREALAVGRPIISTRHGGFSEYDWHDEYGKLVNYGNEYEMVKALRHIYNNFSNYNLENISRMCLSTCSKTVVISEIEKILKTASE